MKPSEIFEGEGSSLIKAFDEAVARGEQQEFNEASFEERFATAKRLYEPVAIQILNANGEQVIHKISNK